MWLEIFRRTGVLEENCQNPDKLVAIDQAIAMLELNGVIPPEVGEPHPVDKPTILRVGDVARVLRIGKGRSPEDMARAMGISKVQLSRIERLKNAPRLDTIMNIADTYSVSKSYLFGDYRTLPNTNFAPEVLADIFRRLTRGQSHQQIGEMIGIGTKQVSAMMNGVGRPVDLVIAGIAGAYDIPVRELSGEKRRQIGA